MAILDRETYREMESLLYKHKNIDKIINDYREEKLHQSKNPHDVTRYRKSLNKIVKPVEDTVINLESDPRYIELNKTKKILDQFVEGYRLSDNEKYRLIILFYFDDKPKHKVIKTLCISDSTYTMWKSEILNNLHKECLASGLVSL